MKISFSLLKVLEFAMNVYSEFSLYQYILSFFANTPLENFVNFKWIKSVEEKTFSLKLGEFNNSDFEPI